MRFHIGLHLTVFALVVVNEAAAASPDHVAGYRIMKWRDADGLPQNTVTGIAHDDSGFLWLATFGGLARFDGRTFERFDLTNGMRTPRAVGIARGASGVLYVGLQDRGVQLVIGDRVVSPPAKMDVDRATVDGIHVSNGIPWMRSRGAVHVWTDTGWREVAESSVAAPDGEGGLWSANSGALEHLAADATEAVITLPPQNAVLSIAIGPDGLPWFITRSGLHRVEDGTIRSVISLELEAHGAGPLFDARGGVWFASGKRLFRYPDSRSVDHSDGRLVEISLDASANVLFEDREQNVWVGTAGDGLWRLTREYFDVIDPGQATGPIVATKDGITFGGACGSFTRQEVDGRLVRERIDGCVSAMAYDESADALWTSNAASGIASTASSSRRG